MPKPIDFRGDATDFSHIPWIKQTFTHVADLK